MGIEIKKLVNELNLDKYYDGFERNDNSFNYLVEIYAYKIYYNDEFVLYIGNKQRPITMSFDYCDEKYNIAEYWLNGNNDEIIILHRYENTSNSLFDRETKSGNKLHNQKLLNEIKTEIVNKLKPNFNVQIIPEDFDITKQIGKNINIFKKIINSTLHQYQFNDYVDDFLYILETIKTNTLYWHKYLILKNRYWLISENKNDIEERKNILFDELTLSQKALVIVMKEWLAMIINESHINPNYNMHIDNIIYKLNNIRFKNIELFNSIKSRFFENKTAIKLILSTMYSNSTPRQIEDVYVRFMGWRKNYMTKIFK